MFLSIAILISIAISQKIDDILKNYEEKKLEKMQNELESLNQSLEEKVKIEIEKIEKRTTFNSKIKINCLR